MQSLKNSSQVEDLTAFSQTTQFSAKISFEATLPIRSQVQGLQLKE